MAIPRIPSLRELRLACPANVSILPTAAPRKVQQRLSRAYALAKRELIASQAPAFPYQPPWARAEQSRALVPTLRPDVPPVDLGNPAHLRAWEAVWDFGNRPSRFDGE